MGTLAGREKRLPWGGEVTFAGVGGGGGFQGPSPSV